MKTIIIDYGSGNLHSALKSFQKVANLNKKEFLVEYFNNFKEDLAKKNLNFFLKGVSNS